MSVFTLARWAVLPFASSILLSARADLPIGTAISISPSEYWDGDDGQWSSFGVQLGTPSQSVRLLPSTSSNSIWPVLPQGCIVGDPSNCADLRGFAFTPNTSSTWSYIGLYQLNIVEETALGYSGNTEAGYENITLGWPGSGAPSLSRQVIQGIATKDFFIGTLGINPRTINLTSFNDQHPSPLAALRAQGTVPSTSWGYTAGAPYLQPPVFGSLTLGGYDSSRLIANNITIPFGADQSRDLLVGIQSITSDTTADPLLPSPIYALIDSLVPNLWLPLLACQAFERAFNLTWNSTAGMYFVSNELHSSLVAQNANITLKLGASSTGGDTVNIIMPYASFDLIKNATFTSNSTRYFPLQRANNQTQYTLGRVFLQEAYIVADYDRSNFSVSRTRFTSPQLAQNLVSIFPPQALSSNGSSIGVPSTSAGAGSSGRGGVSTGAKVGITVGVVLGIAMVVILTIIFLVRRRRQRRQQSTAAAALAAATLAEEEQAMLFRKPELDTTEASRSEVHANIIPTPELQGTAKPTVHELSDERGWSAELPVGGTLIYQHELPAVESPAHEMPAAPKLRHWI